MFSVGDELKVCLVLLIANLVRSLLLHEAAVARLALRIGQVTRAVASALGHLTANPYLGLLLLVIVGQGVGWIGVIMQYGWAEVVHIQTGTK